MNKTIPGFQIVEELFRSKRTIIYRAHRDKDKTSVIIKTLNIQYPSNHEISRFKHEAQITQKMNGEGVIHSYEQIKYTNNLALILEDIQGISLHDYLRQTERFNNEKFLRLAIDISHGLNHIHRQNVIHKDINPTNIVINEGTKKVQIIDFGISNELSREHHDVNVTNKLQGSLAYISPEQTGRMNRKPDYRTDYYSLGVTFYQMLTGVRPFKADDTIGWIHCHIAKIPPTPHELDNSIPQVLSNIVMKLLSKNAENRYQSSIGIIKDLEECHNQMEQQKKIEDFELGQWDISEKFQIPQRLFGRENELKTLFNTFESTVQGGCEYLLVSGYSGVGKSALVHEVYRSIVSERGYFIEGKFDQFQRDIPYSALIQTFQGLVRQLLTETDEKLETWKSILLEAIYPNGQIIIDLIPEVEMLIGKQKPVQSLGPVETQNRFLITFKNFIKVVAQREHPLVIFLDDLQWGDIPTLQLIEYLMVSKEISYFFLIGAFRNKEVKEGHPLNTSLDEIDKVVPLHHILLQPLEESHVSQLVADTVHCDLEIAAPLSSLVYSKTRGNPFFMGELLKDLHKEGAFKFVDGYWNWDIKKISDMDVTDNVVEFMIRRLRKLPQDSNEALQFAACIGNSFDLRTLAMILKQSFANTGKLLIPAIQDGIVAPLDNQYVLVHLQEQDMEELDFGVHYKFQHDRVQQAAYSLLSEDEKKEHHLKIARFLHESTPEKQLQENVIDIASHFNEGIELIAETEELRLLTVLNLMACKKAKRSNAYHPAFQYVKVAKELLPENAWGTSYEHCLEIYCEYADTAYLSRKFEIAEEITKVLLEKARTNLDKAKIYLMQIRQKFRSGNTEDVIRLGIQALSLLGVRLSRKPGLFSILKEIGLVRWNLGKQSVKSLIDMPLMNDPEKQIIMDIIHQLTAPALGIGLKNLFVVLILKVVNLALRFGNSPEAAPSYIAYAVLLHITPGNLKKSYKFGELCLKVNEKLDDQRYRCLCYYMYALTTHCWNNNWKATLPFYKKAMTYGLQSGNLVFTGFAATLMVKWNLGLTLKEAAELGEKHLQFVTAAKLPDPKALGNIWQRYRLNLMGLTKDRHTLSDSVFNEDECLSSMRQRKYLMGIATFWTVKLELCYLYEDFEKGIELIPMVDEVKETVMTQAISMEICFYTFMTLSAAHSKMNRKERSKAIGRMRKEYKRMKKWHDHYPVNSDHLIYMMDAELARIRNKSQSTISLLEKSIHAATENDFLQYKALANKLLGKLYISLNKKRFAGLYLSDAYYDYQVWGASSVLQFLCENYRRYLHSSNIATHQNQRSSTTTTESTSIVSGAIIDMDTVAKAAQAISSEVVLDKLLDKLLRIVQENAGAGKTVLLLPEEGGQNLVIQAKNLGHGRIDILSGEKTENSFEVSHRIIKYVARSLEPVVLGEATREGNFTNDPYIQTHHPKSVLCVPILNQANLVGILYLENSIASNAFTPDRLEVVQILSSQAAIAIKNAQLYNRLLESKAQQSDLLNNTSSVIYIKDLEGRYLFVNQMFEKLFHINNEKIKGTTDYDLFPSEMADAFRSNDLKAIDSTVPLELEEIVLQDDGEHTYISVKFPLKDISGKVYAVSGISTDITERIKAEKQLKQTQKMEAIGTLAGGIAHDFKNMLSIILVSKELAMLKIPEQHPARTYLKQIETASLKSSDLINQLVNFSRPTDLKREPVEINPIINECLDLLRPSISDNIKIHSTIPSDPKMILADPTQIYQVVMNLCTNASHAMSENGGVLEVTLSVITIDQNKTIKDLELNHGQYIKITVKDTGHGIPEDIIDKIFDPYFTTKEVDKGSGIGLSVVHGVIESHEGAILVDSKYGKETTFNVFLPVYKECTGVEVKIDTTIPKGTERLLIIDDEKFIVDATCLMLETIGYSVTAMTSSTDALEVFQNQPDIFDLIITDMTMPEIMGDKLAKKCLAVRPDIPIIICTGFSKNSNDERAKSLGIQAFLFKPFDLNILATTIRNVLDDS